MGLPKMNCPQCDYDGGKYGHTVQLKRLALL